jgi:hypothetical protein
MTALTSHSWLGKATWIAEKLNHSRAPTVRHGLSLAWLLLVGVTILADPSLAEPKIGVASATKNQVRGILGGASRDVSTGSQVFSNELVRTGPDSLAQLLFADQTSLSVGPQSEVKLDRFVYNPERGGNVVIETGRGALRFVTGSQSPANYTVKTPLATIGVRGTVFEVNTRIKVLNNKKRIEEVILLVQGEISIRTLDGQNRELVKPGTALILNDVSGSVTVQGPITWDGTIYDVASRIPFPLYGTSFENDPRYTPAPDSHLDLNDQLDAIILRSLVAPAAKTPCKLPPPSC